MLPDDSLMRHNRKNWVLVTGQVLWPHQDEAALRLGCTAVLGCSLAVGTVVQGLFYPRYGFIQLARGMTWEDVYASWRYQYGTSKQLHYPERVERLSASDACSVVGVYWGREQEGGYTDWQPVPATHCSPVG